MKQGTLLRFISPIKTPPVIPAGFFCLPLAFPFRGATR